MAPSSTPSYKIKLADDKEYAKDLPIYCGSPSGYEDYLRRWMKQGVIISCVREDGKALYTDLATEVTKFLDGVVRETPDCVKCQSTREGCELPDGTKLTAEEVCTSYVVSKKHHPACKFFEHSISVGMLVTVLQTNFRDVAEKTLKEHAICYMRDKKRAYPLGKLNPSGNSKHNYLVRLHGEKATRESDKGKAVAVDRNGNAKANGNDAPAHHYVFMGYQLVSPTSPAPSHAAGSSSDAAPDMASGSEPMDVEPAVAPAPASEAPQDPRVIFANALHARVSQFDFVRNPNRVTGMLLDVHWPDNTAPIETPEGLEHACRECNTVILRDEIDLNPDDD